MQIEWLYVAPKARSGAKRHAAPVLVASGAHTFHAAGWATTKIALTSAGRLMLARSRWLKLTARCTFKAAGEAPVSTSGAFELFR